MFVLFVLQLGVETIGIFKKYELFSPQFAILMGRNIGGRILLKIFFHRVGKTYFRIVE